MNRTNIVNLLSGFIGLILGVELTPDNVSELHAFATFAVVYLFASSASVFLISFLIWFFADIIQWIKSDDL